MKHARPDYNRIQDPAGLIPEDEPVFLLRAQDKSASLAVRAWADDYAVFGGDPIMTKMALEHADKMDVWAKKKTADLPK